MSPSRTGQVVVAVVLAYLLNAGLIVAEEQLLSLIISGAPKLPWSYYVVDLLSQCMIQVIAGYLCCKIAHQDRRALAGLIGLGMLAGIAFLVFSWKSEPLWYGIALLAVYSPCIWTGCCSNVVGKQQIGGWNDQ